MSKFHPGGKRVYGLDILRALSIFFVVYGHGLFILAEGRFSTLPLLALPTLDGVTMFFVLSGYLVGGILIRHFDRHPATASTLLTFWSRRWFRTLPNYFLVLLGLLAFLWLSEGPEALAGKGSYLLFLQNFASPHPAFFPEAWTLAVEEWFYLLVPLALLVLIRLGMSPRNALLTTICTVLVASIAVRYGRFAAMEQVNLQQWDTLFRKQVVTRLDSLMLGVLGAWLHHYLPQAWLAVRKPAFVTGIALLVLTKMQFNRMLAGATPIGFYDAVVSLVLVPAAVLLLLPLLSQLRRGSGLTARAVTFISVISYSMYLLHFTVIQRMLLPWLGGHLDGLVTGGALVLVKYTLYWLLCILCSAGLYAWFEHPTTQLRERLQR